LSAFGSDVEDRQQDRLAAQQEQISSWLRKEEAPQIIREADLLAYTDVYMHAASNTFVANRALKKGEPAIGRRTRGAATSTPTACQTDNVIVNPGSVHVNIAGPHKR
jgi:hypothetical protein